MHFLVKYKRKIMAAALVLSMILSVCGVLPAEEILTGHRPKTAKAAIAMGGVYTEDTLPEGATVYLSEMPSRVSSGTWTYCGARYFEYNTSIGDYTLKNVGPQLSALDDSLNSKTKARLKEMVKSGEDYAAAYMPFTHSYYANSQSNPENCNVDGVYGTCHHDYENKECHYGYFSLVQMPCNYSDVIDRGDGYHKILFDNDTFTENGIGWFALFENRGVVVPFAPKRNALMGSHYRRTIFGAGRIIEYFTLGRLATGKVQVYTYSSGYTGSSSGGYTISKLSGGLPTYPVVRIAPNKVRFYKNGTNYYQLPDDPDGTVTFDANGGTGTQASIGYFTAVSGSYAVDLPEKTTFTAPDGKYFVGWSTAPNSTNTITTIKPTTTSQKLYAVWATKYIKLIYHANGAEGSTPDQTVIGRERTELLSESETEAIFSRKGYKFKGWATTQKGAPLSGNTYNAKYVNTNTEVNLYAVWEPALIYEMIDGKKTLTYVLPEYADNPYIEPDTDVIATGAFDNCTLIRHVTVPFHVSCIEEGAFQNVAATTADPITIEIKNPDCAVSYQSFRPQVTTIRSLAGSRADRLANANADINADTIKVIDKDFFKGEIVTEFYCPKGVTGIGTTADEAGVFEGHTELTRVELGSVETIGNRAFRECINLKGYLTIPESVSTVGILAFQHTGCDRIRLKSTKINPTSLAATGPDDSGIEVCLPHLIDRPYVTAADLGAGDTDIVLGPSVERVQDGILADTNIGYIEVLNPNLSLARAFDPAGTVITDNVIIRCDPGAAVTREILHTESSNRTLYTITLDSGEGSSGVKKTLAVAGEKPSRVAVPVRDGYIFTGYYLDDRMVYDESGTPAINSYDFDRDIAVTAGYRAGSSGGTTPVATGAPHTTTAPVSTPGGYSGGGSGSGSGGYSGGSSGSGSSGGYSGGGSSGGGSGSGSSGGYSGGGSSGGGSGSGSSGGYSGGGSSGGGSGSGSGGYSGGGSSGGSSGGSGGSGSSGGSNGSGGSGGSNSSTPVVTTAPTVTPPPGASSAPKVTPSAKPVTTPTPTPVASPAVSIVNDPEEEEIEPPVVIEKIVEEVSKISSVDKPKRVKIRSVVRIGDTAVFLLKKNKNVKYQLQYTTEKNNWKKAKKKLFKKKKITLRGLRQGRGYYVRIRAFRKVDGKKIFGKWSKIKRI